MAVTLSDVARRAGVSEATASRVLNGRRYVAAGTRLRVEQAVRDLDYLPNRAARDLSTSRTATVAVLVHHGQYPSHGEGTFSSRVIGGISQALRRAGHDTLYVHVDDDAVARLVGLAAVRPGRSDGVIVIGPAFPTAAVENLVAFGRPVVTVDNLIKGVDAVLADNRRSMAEITRHLVEDHGYRRLACLAGPLHWPSTAERLDGVRAAAGLGGAVVRVVHARETTMRDGSETMAGLIDDLPDAVIAVNDAMAIGAMHRLRGLETARPAITGFDDIAWAQLTDPPLTTVRVDVDRIGAGAAELMLSRMSTPDAHTLPAREIRAPALVQLRRSCGCSGSARPIGTFEGGG